MVFPTGNSWIDWRYATEQHIRERLLWPLDGICFDIENNVFWLEEWGAKPATIQECVEIARQAFFKATKLIPICSHRYIPATPSEAGNPVYSVHQTDVIYYGFDLLNYLQNEFSYYFGLPEYQMIGTPRQIAFWTHIVELNG